MLDKRVIGITLLLFAVSIYYVIYQPFTFSNELAVGIISGSFVSFTYYLVQEKIRDEERASREIRANIVISKIYRNLPNSLFFFSMEIIHTLAGKETIDLRSEYLTDFYKLASDHKNEKYIDGKLKELYRKDSLRLKALGELENMFVDHVLRDIYGKDKLKLVNHLLQAVSEFSFNLEIYSQHLEYKRPEEAAKVQLGKLFVCIVSDIDLLDKLAWRGLKKANFTNYFSQPFVIEVLDTKDSSQ